MKIDERIKYIGNIYIVKFWEFMFYKYCIYMNYVFSMKVKKDSFSFFLFDWKCKNI